MDCYENTLGGGGAQKANLEERSEQKYPYFEAHNSLQPACTKKS